MSAEPPRWRQYIPTVRAFVPGCDGEELRDRCGLLLMRDMAAATKVSCSEESYYLLEHVERTATNHAFRGMPQHYLSRLRYELTKVVSAASGLELFARGNLLPDTVPDTVPDSPATDMAAPGEGENGRG